MGPMHVPEGLARLRSTAEGARWLDALPGLVEELVESWDLEIGEPFEASSVSWVAPARRGDESLVLKVQWPHPECEHEAEALRAWASGGGAVELIDHRAEQHALLLERCRPGTPLSEQPDVDVVEVMTALLPRLWVPAAGPFRTLEAEAEGWASSLVATWDAAGRPCERRLVDAARSLIADLAPSQDDQVLVHQDLHGENVLAAQRSPWLAIDPKPLLGERAFSVAPIVRAFEFGHTERAVRDRLDGLCAALGLDRERARGWTVAQTMAWSFSSTYREMHHATARWLLGA